MIRRCCPGPSGDPGSSADLRAVTYNVRNGLTPERRLRRLWWVRRPAVWAVMADLSPDIVALQEAHGFQLRGLTRGATGYTVVGARPRGRWVGERCPLIVRADRFGVVSAEVGWFTDDGFRFDRPGARMADAGHPRLASIVRLHDRRPDRDLVVINVHLDPATAARRRAIVQLSGLVDHREATLVLGDFNAGVGELGPLLAGGLAAVPVAGATFHGFTEARDGEAIDHVLIGRGIEVADAFVDHSRPGSVVPSDHWPVVADLVMA